MKAPRILPPLVVMGFALAAALATAAPAHAAATQPQAAPDAGLQPADVRASFNLVLLADVAPAPVTKANEAAARQQAEVAALFDVAPLTPAMRARLVRADATLMKAEVAALFDVAPQGPAVAPCPIKWGPK